MNNDFTILDDEFRAEESFNPDDNLASTGTRFANNILDTIGTYIFLFLMMAFIGVIEGIFETGMLDETESSPVDALLGLWVIMLFPSYYLLSEYFFQKTPAKFLTRCTVVKADGSKPDFATCLGRTLCRFIPFEPFSFLGSKPIGWHDKFSGTRVVKDK